MQKLIVVLCLYFYGVSSHGSGNNENLRLCVAEGRGFKKASKFCPVLERESANVECVIGSDRMDCLRRMGKKGSVDFAVVDPEDLVASQWANIDLLVTNQIKNKNRDFAAEIACVVSRSILPDAPVGSASVILEGAKLCHPGHGAMGISDTLSEYLESLVTELSCDSKHSLLENRLMSVEKFFSAACKPGPWVKDETRDSELKRLHPKLCSICYSKTCSKDDAFYGSQGALNCLTLGAGTVTWASVDDVMHRFGLNGETVPLDDASGYRYLCRDGSWLPLNTTTPCVWLNVPWPVIVAKSKSAEAVRSLQMKLTDDSAPVEGGWRSALLALLESREALSQPLLPQQAPADYLSRARGFQEAYSRTGCNPSRHITICTSSTVEYNKCLWMSESGSVYGVEPPAQCSARESRERCLEAVRSGEADAVAAGSDWLVKAMRDYSLQPVLFEKNNIVSQMHIIVAYVMADSSINKMADLRGKMAAFPVYNGVAWNSVSAAIRNQSNENIVDFFKDLCVFDSTNDRLTKLCSEKGEMNGDEAALKMLAEKKVDVAFVSMDALEKYTGFNGAEPWASKLSKNDFKSVCPYNQTYCYFAWSSPGQIYISNSTSPTRRREIINMFLELDILFGTKYPFDVPAFNMYGAFNGNTDVMFHDNMKSLTTLDGLTGWPHSQYPWNYEIDVLSYVMSNSAGVMIFCTWLLYIFAIICVFLS